MTRCWPGTCLVAILLLAAPGQLWAQGPPILNDTPITTGLEGSALRIFWQGMRFEGLVRDGGQAPDPLQRRVSVNVIPAVYPFYVDPDNTDWVTMLVAPHVEKDLTSAMGGLRNSGLGDISVLTKFRLSRRDGPGQTTQWSATAGLKLPTGDSDARDGSGKFLPPGLQVGSGSYDVPISLIFGHIQDRLGLYANVGWTSRGEGARAFQFGDSLDFGAALGYRLSPAVYKNYPARSQLNFLLELTGNSVRHSDQNGIEVANSGGTTLFLSPGIQLIRGGNLLLEAAYQIPIERDLTGTQLRPDDGFLFGARYLF